MSPHEPFTVTHVPTGSNDFMTRQRAGPVGVSGGPPLYSPTERTLLFPENLELGTTWDSGRGYPVVPTGLGSRDSDGLEEWDLPFPSLDTGRPVVESTPTCVRAHHGRGCRSRTVSVSVNGSRRGLGERTSLAKSSGSV